MPNPLEQIKKIKGRSLQELRERGEQAFAARAEQIGLSGKLPSDEEFLQLIDSEAFGGEAVTPETLFEKFYEDAQFNFFPAFRQKEEVLKLYRQHFGRSARIFVEKAEKIVEGKFDLLGFENLNFGDPINWHYEPISGKTSPIKHWKQFDELSTEETGDKKIVWELNRHQHFFTLGVAYWLTDDERFAETFVAHLEGWMETNAPGSGVNWVSSLEVSFRLISWIWAFHFFKDSVHFTPHLFYKTLKFVHQHARHLSKYLSTYYSPNTHLTGEALGLYYFGTQFQFFKNADAWRTKGEKILYAELDRQIFNDGVYFEQSTWYQRYTTDFYMHFLILKTLSGEKTDHALQSKLHEKLSLSTNFLRSATLPDGTIAMIGDDDGGRMLPHGARPSNDFRPTFSTSAILFERGDFKSNAGEYAEETLWLLGIGGAQKYDSLTARISDETLSAFTDGGYFTMRDGWSATDNFLLVDCGEIGALSGGHGHADALSVNLAVGGKTMLVDSGTYTYHESLETRAYFRASEAHNTLTIDGKSQSEPNGKFSWRTRANADLHKWIAQDRFGFFEGSNDGYQRLAAPATHTRSILFLKNDYTIVRDFVKTAGTHDYKLNFHFHHKADPSIATAENGMAFVSETSDENAGLQLFTFGDNGSWQKKTSPVSDCYGKKIDAAHLQFVSSGTGAQEFFSFLLPVKNDVNVPQVFETEIVGGRAFVINFKNYRDLLVFSDGEALLETEFFATNFRFFWARLSENEQLPEEFVLIGGTRFTLDGKEIINSLSELEFATAKRFGDQLNLQTPETVVKISLSQNVQLKNKI